MRTIQQSSYFPGDGVGAPGYVVVRDAGHGKPQRYVVHFLNTQSGGYHHGYYTDDLAKAVAAYVDKCARLPAEPWPGKSEPTVGARMALYDYPRLCDDLVQVTCVDGATVCVRTQTAPLVSIWVGRQYLYASPLAALAAPRTRRGTPAWEAAA